MATGELLDELVDGLLLYTGIIYNLFRRLWTITAVYALRDRGADCFHLAVKPAATRFAVGSADRLLAVFFRSAGSTPPSLANLKIS